MKKAFTIAEAIISAAMLGVLAVVLFPMLQDFQPNKDKTSYNKALFSMQSAVSNVMEESYSIAANRILSSGSTETWKDEDFLRNLTQTEACEEIAKNFNLSGTYNCGGQGSYESPNFITSDGIRFWGIGGDAKFASGGKGGSQLIYMDREMKKSDWKKRKKDFEEITNQKWTENNNLKDEKPGLKLIVRYDGKVHTGTGNIEWGYENGLIKKSMSMNLKDEKKTTKTEE